LLEEDLETKFKDVESSLKIVFVCSMWLTGFDVPNMSTLYLDKPMKNHTLMQTIARTNRVFAGKTNGLIVDYIGIFQNLKDALAIYASTDNTITGKIIENKSEMIGGLRTSIGELQIFLSKI
jgi:type I restriction enzyme R subunit